MKSISANKQTRPPAGLSRYSRPLVIALWSAMLMGAVAYGQTFNVVDVKVEGAVLASPSLVLSVAGINPGDQLTASVTQDAVKRLYGLGFFHDIQILAEETTGGIILTIRVKELPKLNSIIFKGNSKIKEKDLVEKIKLPPGGFLAPHEIYEKKAEIIDLYAEKGYFLANVTPLLNYSEDSASVEVTFQINEGSKVKVEKVVLTGNDRIPADKIVGKMRNRKRGFLKSSNFDKDKFPEDKEKIIQYLHELGYIDAYLKSDSFAIDTAANRMSIFIDIYEGPRYYFGGATFVGNKIIPENALKQALKFRKGSYFDQEKYDESIYEVYYLYQEEGYLHVQVQDSRKTEDSLINITYEIIEGVPSEVNLVQIIGNTKTKEKVIRREMSIRPGQVFHRSLLIRSVRNIMQLNYFGNVEPDIVDLPSGDVDVVVKVEEKPTGQVSAGAGYSGQDKFVGTFGLGIPNFRGMGQNLSFNVDIGSRRNSYSVSFTEPWFMGTPTSIGGDLYFLNRRWYEDYTEGRRGGSVRLGRRLKWPDDYFRVYARYRLEDDRFYEFSDDYKLTNSELYRNFVQFDSAYYNDQGGVDSVKTIDYNFYTYGDPLPGSLQSFGEDWFTSSSLTWSITRDSRNLPEFATKGSIVSYSLSMTGGILGGYWKYQQHEMELAKFIPIIGNIALAGKLTLAGIHAGDDNKILESDRYSPGGTGYDAIVRGYDDGTLTPDTVGISAITYQFYSSDELNVRPDLTADPDSTADSTRTYTARVRGKYMVAANLELQVPLISNQLYLLGFFDAGRAWLHRRDIKLNQVYRGVGFGFRLVVPGIGTIGFDFGYPLDERPGQDKGWKPHFQIGTTFNR